MQILKLKEKDKIDAKYKWGWHKGAYGGGEDT